MKKYCALFLCFLLLLPCLSATAADGIRVDIVYDDSMTVSTCYPEGYTVESFVENGILGAVFAPEDINRAEYMLIIAPDEEYPELERLNDLSEAELEAYAASVLEDYNNPAVTRAKTSRGSLVFVVDESDSEYDEVMLLGIYRGFNMALYCYYEDGHTVADADIQTGLQIFSDMDLIYS